MTVTSVVAVTSAGFPCQPGVGTHHTELAACETYEDWETLPDQPTLQQVRRAAAMHPELLQCLIVLAVARLLVLAAAPAPAPPYARCRRPDPAPVTDQLRDRVAAARPARVRAAPAESAHAPAPPEVTTLPAAVPVTDPDSDGRPAGPPRRRGVRSRRRGSRGGRIWRTVPRPGQLYIGELNIQSLKPKLLELRHDISEHGYDVIVLNETWMKTTTPNRLVPIPGYQLVRRDRPDNRGYGGVAIAVRESLELTTVERPGQPVAGSKLESLWVQLRAGSHRLMICAAYRPPVQTQARVSADLDELEEQIQHVLTRHSGPIVLAGDLNINLNSDTTASTRLRQLLSTYSLQQHVTGSTFRSSGSIIDVICSTHGVTRAGVLHCTYSPHNWTRALLHLPDYRPREIAVTARCWSRLDRDEVNRLLGAVDWSPVFASDDPEVQWDYFLTVTRPILDSVAPIKRRKVYNPTAPFITNDTKNLMARRRVALRQHDRESYKDLNRQVQSAIRRDSREELDRRLREAGPSGMWRVVRPVIGSKRQARTAPSADADALNRYFVSVGPDTARQVDSSGPELPVRLPRVATGRFQVAPISPDDLCRVVSRMRNSAACGADGLCIRFIKICLPSVHHVITHIVNSSLASHHVPDSWKLALVHPIQKTAKSTDIANYRPISILPTIAKIVERVVYEQLFYYFAAHHLFSSSQHGFRSNHSTDTALLSVTDHVFSAMDRSHITLLCLLDCSKCFDVIPHDPLLRKLELYGVDTRWFRSYLDGHYQQVQLQEAGSGRHVTSEALVNPIGTYQGSALGPLLFSIYANDLPLYTEDMHVVQYADDTQVAVSGWIGDIGSLVQHMEHNLALLSRWFGKNGIKINAQKTQFIIFGSRQNIHRLSPVTIKFMDAEVAASTTVLNLGVTFDQYMTFTSHVDIVVQKCTGMLCGLSHSRHSLPQSTLSTLIQGLVISRVLYCLTVYGVCNKTQMKRIQKVLNFAARVLSGRRRFDHISDVLNRLDWLTAEHLYLYRGLILLKRMLATAEPESIAGDLVTRGDVHHRTTRNADHLVTPAIRSESGRRRFKHSVVTAFNALPCETRNLTTNRFKRELRQHLLTKQRGGVG